MQHDGRQRAEPGDTDTPKVCYCMRVHAATIRRAIRAGARDLAAIQQATKAGTGCGTCRIDLVELLREQAGEPAQ